MLRLPVMTRGRVRYRRRHHRTDCRVGFEACRAPRGRARSGLRGERDDRRHDGDVEVLPDQGCQQLIRDFGEDDARRIVEARWAAVDAIERWTQELNVDCDFRRLPAYTFTEDLNRRRQLEDECDAAQRLGIMATMTDAIGLPFDVAGAIRYENQARSIR